jgi:YXWGXW repeat-containing protein
MRIVRLLGLVLLTAVALGIPAASHAQIAVGISVRIGPPALPVYEQPVCPAPGYIWTPGYWAHNENDYYWVPGTWVMAPEPGLLWTPGYWGFSEGVYIWHRGYWGPHVGFYGGINYGFGYTGVGFWGGEWRGREFVYNRSVTNVNVTVIHNYYNRTVVVNNVNRVSFNGGPHGIQARESERERIAEHEHHFEARREQVEHEHTARSDRSQWASVNHGRPAVAASGGPGDFHRDVVTARGGREAEHRADSHAAERRDDHRADRSTNAVRENRNTGRNDRPTNAVNRENGQRSAPSNNVRQARESRPVPQGEAHGNQGMDRAAPQRSNAPQGEARGNPHMDQHSSPSRGNSAHENAPHSNGKPEHGKREKP